MLVILRWRVFRIHIQWQIPTEYSDFRQLSITNQKNCLLQIRSVLLGNWLQVVPWHYFQFIKFITD
jgi:hypothetical protein